MKGKGIKVVYWERKMASEILGVNKPGLNRQVLLMEYGHEAMLKLGKSLGWDFSRG